jgi:hypothetical protein
VHEVPDEGEETVGADVDAVSHRIEISTNYVSLVLDYAGATPDVAYWTWKRCLDALARLRAEERMDEVAKPRMEANAAGFVIEQADESHNNSLPGGGFAL